MNLRHLDPNAPAGDECVIGRVRGPAATAKTRVELTGAQADALTSPSEARDALIAALAEAADQADHDAVRVKNRDQASHLAALARKWRAVIARAEESRA
jgi:hypothetical protein